MAGRGNRILYHSAVAVLAIGVVYASSPRLQNLAQTARPRKSASPSCPGTLYVYDTSRFLAVDRSTGNTTYVSTIDVSKLSFPQVDLHMRFAPDGTLYGSDGGRRLIIDIDTGAVADDGLDVEAEGRSGSTTRWMPPGFLAEGSPVVGYSTNHFNWGSDKGALNFTRIDSLEPFVRVPVPVSAPLAFNIGIGDAISNDGSSFYFVTTDLIYKIPLTAPSMSPWIQLAVFDLSSDARLDTDDSDHMFIADGVFLYDVNLVTRSLATTRLSGNINTVQDVLFRRCPQGGVRISPTRGLQTSESGTTATFDAVLTKAPTSDVTIGLSSSIPTEGTPSPASLTFTTANWNVPHTVTVTGVADQTIDGNTPYSIITSAASSADPNYSGRFVSDVTLTNADIDTAAINVSTSSVRVTEGGASVPVTVSLTSRPSADVTVPLRLSNGQATLSASSVTFTNANWSPRQVLVTAVADQIDDGDQPFTISIDPPSSSADTNYASIDPADVSGTAIDVDTASILVTPKGPLSVTEGGPAVTLTISLTSRPLADVTIPISVSNGEATVSAPSVTFTNTNWSPRQVQVTAVNDAVDDGDLPFTVILSPSTSSDPLYAGIDLADISGTAVDDDTASIIATPASGLSVVEGGAAVPVTLSLGSRPASDVVVPLSIAGGQASVSVPSVTFTNADWSPRQVQVTAVDDLVDDGDLPFTLTLGAPITLDPLYAAIRPAGVSGTAVDNDTASVSVDPTAGLVTTEAGGQATFQVVLGTQPVAVVRIDFTSSNTAEATVSPAFYLFDNTNWNVPRTVTVTGVDDPVADGNQNVTIVTTLTTTDAAYAAINPADVTLMNIDNEGPPQISIAPARAVEGQPLLFTLTLTHASTSVVTADYATFGDTASSNDYTPTSGTATFNAGSRTTTITVPTTADTAYELDETLHVTLSNAQNGSIAVATATGTIVNDDAMPVLSIANAPAVKTADSVSLTVTLSAAAGVPVTVNFATADGTATAGSDYRASAGTLTFAPSVTTQTIIVPLLTDPVVGPPETFLVFLTSPVNATLGGATATVTIQDPATIPTLDPLALLFLAAALAFFAMRRAG